MWHCWPDELHKAGTWRKQCEVRPISEARDVHVFFMFCFLNV
jgi:hypothetical protein